MAITFRCEHCGKQVSAPDTAGGRAGKCPYCQQRCYIPTPSDRIEEIPLAPVDPKEQARTQKLRRQALQYQASLLEAKESPRAPLVRDGDGGGTGSSGEPPATPLEPLDVEVEETTSQCVLSLAQGRLDELAKLVRRLGDRKAQALRVLDRMAERKQIHPDLKKLPPKVLAGFIDHVRKSLGG